MFAVLTGRPRIPRVTAPFAIRGYQVADDPAQLLNWHKSLLPRRADQRCWLSGGPPGKPLALPAAKPREYEPNGGLFQRWAEGRPGPPTWSTPCRAVFSYQDPTRSLAFRGTEVEVVQRAVPTASWATARADSVGSSTTA